MNSFMLLAGGGEVPPIELVPTWADRLENLSVALQATLIGIVMVFVVLGLLIGLIYLVRLFIWLGERKKAEAMPIPLATPIGEDNASLAAAITAAIAAIYDVEAEEAGAEPVDFIVTNIKRIR